jgi:hypothetical protein
VRLPGRRGPGELGGDRWAGPAQTAAPTALT